VTVTVSPGSTVPALAVKVFAEQRSAKRREDYIQSFRADSGKPIVPAGDDVNLPAASL
jgi:hypothetical protein